MPASESHVHEAPVRVRYGEVDRMGVTYHAHYLVYFEHGRTEFMRSLGGTYRELEEDGTLLVVVETGVRHHRPAHYDDLLIVRTSLTGVGSVRIRFDYELVRGDVLLATGFTVLASTDLRGKPRRLPAGFRTRLDGLGPRRKIQTGSGVQGGSISESTRR